jgi:hypothetical protein
MSCDGTAWAWEQRHVPCPQRLVLLTLGNNYNPEDGTSDTSLGFIAKDTGLDMETVNGCMLALIGAGLVRITRRGFWLNIPGAPGPAEGRR